MNIMPFNQQAGPYLSFYRQHMGIWYSQLVGIPLLYFSALILLGFIHVVIPNVLDLKLADFAVLAFFAYYLRVEWRLGLITLPLGLLLLWLAHLINYAGPTALSLWVFSVLLIIAIASVCISKLWATSSWSWQRWLQYLCLAPLCLIAEGFFSFGWLSTLQESIPIEQTKKKEKAQG